jgi:hypothetical protein
VALIRNGNGRSRDRLFSRSLHLPEMTPTGAAAGAEKCKFWLK